MLELNPNTLQETHRGVANEIREKSRQLQKLAPQIRRTRDRQEYIQRQLDELLLHAQLLKKAHLVALGVPEDVTTLRTTILNKMAKASRKDIRISTKEALETEIKTLKGELQKNCRHTFVLEYSGYKGSQSYDFDDRFPGCRVCVVCGFAESSWKTGTVGISSRKEHLYETLDPKSERVIAYKPNLFACRTPLDMWKPLEKLLAHFVDPRVKEILRKYA